MGTGGGDATASGSRSRCCGWRGGPVSFAACTAPNPPPAAPADCRCGPSIGSALVVGTCSAAPLSSACLASGCGRRAACAARSRAPASPAVPSGCCPVSSAGLSSPVPCCCSPWGPEPPCSAPTAPAAFFPPASPAAATAAVLPATAPPCSACGPAPATPPLCPPSALTSLPAVVVVVAAPAAAAGTADDAAGTAPPAAAAVGLSLVAG
mmetsp:Transcript_30344/g.78908  ORF Transcript_30344/g.78908 Transcript_30344/m.78908 type:complete len:209 (-) Transcript_30344:202-828(-)